MTWVGDENETIVTATYADAPVTAVLPGSVALALHHPLFLEYHVYNSNGFHSSARLDVENGTVENRLDEVAIDWYARDYETPPWRWTDGVFNRLAELVRGRG
jgi:hypothetical protein